MADQDKKQQPKRVDIGGQAVLEGVMMKAPRAIAIAVRKPNGRIAVETKASAPLTEKHKWMGWPLVRGVVNLVNMLIMGMDTMNRATALLGVMDEEPSKFEKWLSKTFNVKIEKVIMAVAIVLALALSVGLFILLPGAAAQAITGSVKSQVVVNLVAGLVRILILIGYIAAMGFIKDIRRVFQYHGAEHKTVYCNEAGKPLTVENARAYSRLHPRCGTSFLLLVMIISILVASVADQALIAIFGLPSISYGLRVARSLLIFPLVAGISYEVLKGLAHSENLLVRILRWPGLMMQYLTTREPDDQMLEVAIVSMQSALACSEGAPQPDFSRLFAMDGAEPEPAPEAVAEGTEEPVQKESSAPEAMG